MQVVGDIIVGLVLLSMVGIWIYQIIDYFSKEKRDRRKWIRSVMESPELSEEEKERFYYNVVILPKLPVSFF